jgi:hypothetical protein
MKTDKNIEARERPEPLSARVYVKESLIHGKGVFAKRLLKKGEFIGAYEGPIAKRDGTYVLWVFEDDGSSFGISGRNMLKYLNHRRRCNAEFDGNRLYAQRSIRPDDEITFHYGEEWRGID